MADGKAPVCAAGGAPVTKQYIYSLYDAKTGALRAKGTPQELMEQGYYNRAESVCTGYAHQKKKKAKPKNKDYTIDEIKEKAKELGTTYGKVVLGLQLGTIDRW